MFDRLISIENLFACWDEFKRGKTKKSDVLLFERHLEDNIFQLHQDLKTQTYRHGPYTTFHINDPKPRVISKAAARDRLAHHAVFAELYRIFDPAFIYHSYSSRIGKGTHLAIRNLSKSLRQVSRNYNKPAFALKCDIKKFFQSVSHQKLLQLIHRRIKDKKFLWLIEEVIDSFAGTPLGGAAINSSLQAGLPIGNVTSQIFANIYLNELDQFVKHELKVKYYFRYADDFVMVHGHSRYLTGIISVLRDFLSQELFLELHPGKVSIRKLRQGIDFLGYVILSHHIALRTRTKKRMLKKLFQKHDLFFHGLLGRESFEQTAQSYAGLLNHCDAHDFRVAIENNFSAVYNFAHIWQANYADGE